MFSRNQVRRRRVSLVVLLATSLVLLTVWFGESAGGALHAIQRGAQEVLSPLEEGASRAFKPFSDLADWTGDVLDAKKENEQLKSEVEKLRAELAEAVVDQREAEQLRSLVRVSRGLPDGTQAVTARVIAHSPTVWHSHVQVNKGSDDGVKVDQPVITAGGLAGKVVDVTGGTARVALITNADSAVSAQVMPAGVNGIVKPEIGGRDLLLDFIPRGSRLSKDQQVVTSGFRASGLESLFPRGIPIGRVSKVDDSELEVYQRVRIRPYADLRRMDFVQVLTRVPEQPPVAQVASP
jgi:rod shape-determining protein MreC